MKRFFSFIIKQSVAIVLIVVFVLAFGVYSTINMSINLLPDINVPMVCVQVIYPGANAASVEKDVTTKLEDGLSVNGVTDIQSYSYDNLSALILSFDYGTDTTEKKNDIQSKLLQLDLPDGVSTSVYDVDLNAEALAVLSLTSENGADDAYVKAKELSAKLSAIEGVASVEIKGGAEYSYTVSPFVGLELICPLLVQAFSYGVLDLPLGNISGDGKDVQIRNNSDVASLDDIKNMPIELPSSVVSLLSSVKQIMSYYEDSTQEDLIILRDDLDSGVADVLRRLDDMSEEDIDKFAELKTYMNIADSYTAEQLKTIKTSRYYDSIYRQTVDDEGNPKSDEEIEDLAEDINSQYPFTVSADLLKVVRDKKLDDIIAFREEIEQGEGFLEAQEKNEYYQLTDEEYLLLAREMQVYGDEYSDEQVSENIDFAKKTSATGLANIADKKREEGKDYNPTNAECALLFTATELSDEHPIIMSPTFIAFVRSEHYDDNMQLLIDRRGELGNDISAGEFYQLYTELNLEGVMEITLSEQLIDFILVTDLTALTVNSSGNSVLIVKVSDVANVSDPPKASYSSYAYYYGGEVNISTAIIIEVYKSNGANSSAVVEEVKKVYSSVAGEEGYTAKISLLDDQSEFISDSISNVLVSMLIGGVLAILIIFLFLKKVKTSLVIAVTMPLSVLAALICLALMGITLNMVSLGGLAVGIGMLVDNSIVVIEAISKHRERGKTAFEAAVDGTVEVGGALFGSTLTTVCVFIPILFSGGLTAEIFTDLAYAVIFSLTFSLIVAVTVIPALYSLFEGRNRILRGGIVSTQKLQSAEIPEEREVKKEKYSFKKPVVMDAVTKGYGKILPKVLGKKLITIITAVAVFGASIGLLFLTGTEFLPSIDKGQIEVAMTYGSGRELETVQSDVLQFTEVIRENVENLDYISASVGKNGLLALTDTGIITVQLTTNRNTDDTVNYIRELSKQYPTVGTVTVKQIDGVVASLMSGSDDLSVTVVGSDGEKLTEISEKIKQKLAEENFEDIKDSATDKYTQYTLEFDRNELAKNGIDYQTVILTLRIGIASYTACVVTIDGDDYDLNVKFDDTSVVCKDDLENFVIGYNSAEGTQIKLKDVLKGGQVKEELTEACIRRSNGDKMISISAVLPNVDTGSAGKKMQKAAQEVLDEYAGYTFESSGISSYLNDAFAGLAVALVVSFFLLYAVMAVQFGSFLKPLIVMASIPFSFTGGFIALVITRTSLNVVSFIGLIMLMGVVVNNAIVMLEKIKQLKDEGMPHFDAVTEACKVRLRPILMTTLTTILALIPMAIGVGQGSELMQPLGIVVIGGLLIGTLVTLALVPAVYCAVHRLSAKYPDGKKKEEN